MAADDVDYAGGKAPKTGMGAKVRSCCNSVYNPQKKEVFGRTGSSWAKIGAFYLVFYSCLAGFFAIMLVGFFATLDDTKPTMQDMYSLIKKNPGMGFRPMVGKDSTLVKFNSSDPDTYHDKIQDILLYLRETGYLDSKNNYSTIEKDSNGKPTFNFSEIALDGKCKLDYGNINASFGFSEGKPCILLKINRVINWVPESFNDSMDSDFAKEAEKAMKHPPDHRYAGISCEGENDGDVDNLKEVEFIPAGGFSVDYYPYENAGNYTAPLVFAKFTNVEPGVVMQIWCKLWTKNIKHHKNDKAGSVHFELMVDDKKN